MILRILREKFLRLGRDDDGVALVTTLAVFMFMYLVCIGVYAIGTAVKTRIHLQNACDAAAYSAALVQADTLSRIATLNRAMAWTYIALSRRQMDWITYCWLEEVCEHWQDDHDRAKNWAEGSTATCTLVWPHHGYDWYCSPITLHGATKVSPPTSKSTIQIADSTFRYSHEGVGPSFYSSSSMTGQITDDWETIRAMGEMIEDLKDRYDQLVDPVVEEVIRANLPAFLAANVKPPKCFFEKMSTYTEVLDNTSQEEDRFLSFVRMTRQSAFGYSGNENSVGKCWFVRKGDSGRGFRRGYNWGNSVLRANWTWYSYQWHCKNVDGVDVHLPPPRGLPCFSCSHPSHFRCMCSGLGNFSTSVYADNDKSRDDYYETKSQYRAKPQKLKKEYFQKYGTITVGLACENQNPWAPILGTAIRGIFSAFNYGGELPWTPKYTVCFASAKTGWKETLNWNNAEGIENNRAYRVDWQDGDWNLCQSDLDAVLIPVRRAESFASGKSWQGGVGGFLASYAESGLGVSRANMKAGGNGLDVSTFYHGRMPGEEYRFGNDSGFWGGANPPVNQDPSGTVNARWQIGQPNQSIQWENLQKVMFH